MPRDDFGGLQVYRGRFMDLDVMVDDTMDDSEESGIDWDEVDV